MDWDPTVWRRQSIRARDYDYARACAYFITICTEKRAPLFGKIVDGREVLYGAGQMVLREWHRLPSRFQGLQLDAFIVMPDHVHGLILLGPTAGLYHVPDESPVSLPHALGKVVGAFKSITTHAYIQGVKSGHLPPFDKRVWQRNYYECIIGADSELAKVRIYIQSNPSRALPPFSKAR